MKVAQKAYRGILQLNRMSDDLQDSGFKRKIVSEAYSGQYYRRTDTGHETIAFKLDFTMVSNGLKKLLSPVGYNFLVHNILGELKLNNVLWHCSSYRHNSRTRAIIRELKDRQVLFATEMSGLFIVNPLHMAKGSPAACVECTKKAIRANGDRTDLGVVRDLRANPLRYGPDPGDFAPNLLEEVPG